MPRNKSDVPEIYLEPGDTCLVRKPAILKTVLGSCVGIAFCVPRLGIGALCHPMLPTRDARTVPRVNARAGRRYVDLAIREMCAKFDALGASREEVQVKIFGGADVLAANSGAIRASVGKMNGETALRVLEEEGFTVLVSKLGGKTGIHIQFHTGTGEVLLRRLQHIPAAVTIDR